MFITIEGVDGSGKTSLTSAICSRLAQKYPQKSIEKFHINPPQELTRESVITEYALRIARTDWSERLAVGDRWHWGEIAYAPVKRPHTCEDEFGLLGVSGWRWVELFIASRGLAQFWLHPPLSTLTKRISERGDDFISLDDLKQIHLLYEKAASKTINLAQKLTPPDDLSQIDSLADSIISISESITEKSKILSKFPEYIGSSSPSALLVEGRDARKFDFSLPVIPLNNPGNDFLLSALPEDFWGTIGFVNCEDVHGPYFFRLLDALNSPRIIAIGRSAELALRSSGLYEDMYTVIPHPDQVRTFYPHEKETYGRAIQSFSWGRMEEYPDWVLK